MAPYGIHHYNRNIKPLTVELKINLISFEFHAKQFTQQLIYGAITN